MANDPLADRLAKQYDDLAKALGPPTEETDPGCSEWSHERLVVWTRRKALMIGRRRWAGLDLLKKSLVAEITAERDRWRSLYLEKVEFIQRAAEAAGLPDGIEDMGELVDVVAALRLRAEAAEAERDEARVRLCEAELDDHYGGWITASEVAEANGWDYLFPKLDDRSEPPRPWELVESGDDEDRAAPHYCERYGERTSMFATEAEAIAAAWAEVDEERSDGVRPSTEEDPRDDAARAVAAAPDGWTRGLMVLETADGNFMSLTRGEGLELAAEAARLAMGGEVLDDEDKAADAHVRAVEVILNDLESLQDLAGAQLRLARIRAASEGAVDVVEPPCPGCPKPGGVHKLSCSHRGGGQPRVPGDEADRLAPECAQRGECERGYSGPMPACEGRCLLLSEGDDQ